MIPIRYSFVQKNIDLNVVLSGAVILSSGRKALHFEFPEMLEVCR